MSSLLLDTNILSYKHNDHTFWALYEPRLEGQVLCIAAQTVAEMRFGALRSGWGQERRARLERLLSSHAVLFPDDSICTAWAELRIECERKGRPMQPADLWIAATAKALDIPLVTHNRRDFDFLEGLSLVSEET
ncbi:MAG: PIN domain-containing protein [Thermaceae bacterium]|nr:PIN domain-containing protein [Thermaceae bacterium]